MFIIPKFIDEVIKNTVGQIKYRESITTGEVTVDNGDGTYAVKIAQAGIAIPNIPTAHYGDTFTVGEIAIITYEYGNKEMPRIWGHAKKIAQNPVEVVVDYSNSGGDPITTVTTLDAYSITGATAYLEGRIVLSGGAGNCTRRGFKYGLTTAYGSDIHEDGDYGEGAFALQVSGLTAEETYHYQAYVLDANGDEQIGDDKSFVTEVAIKVKMYIVSEYTDAVQQYSVQDNLNLATVTPDDIKFSVASQDGTAEAVAFSSDGGKMYILGWVTDTVYQYSLSVAWDISTASYDNVSFSVNTQESAPVAMYFKPDGTKMYISGQNGRIFQYSLSIAWDMSTASYDSINYNTYPGQTIYPYGIHFKLDGSKMYIMGNDYMNGYKGAIYQYSLSTPWDVNTASYEKSFDISSQGSGDWYYDIDSNSDGNLFHVVDDNGYVYQYSLSIAWDVGTAVYDVNYKVNAQEGYSSGNGIAFQK